MTPIYKMVDGVEVRLTEEEIAEWVALQEEAPLAQWAEIRAERNAKLAACDWTQYHKHMERSRWTHTQNYEGETDVVFTVIGH
jgi:hypothetical protein